MPISALSDSTPWRPLAQCALPASLHSWLCDDGSLTRRLQALGEFRVVPGYQAIALPDRQEQQLLAMPPRQWALIREVTLHLDNQPVVAARSILPLTSLIGANRLLGQMGSRSLGSELYRVPVAHRDQVWARHARPHPSLPPCWGRQSRFIKRDLPLLVAEYFLPGLEGRLAVSC